MKAILKFDLNDPDDCTRFNQCNRAEDMYNVLWEISMNSRNKFTKYKEHEEDAYHRAVYDIFDHIHDLLENADLKIT